MAGITVLGCRNMRRIDSGTLADCIDAIMTGIATIAGYGRPTMIDMGIGEQGRGMAHTTILGGIQVNRRGRCAGRAIGHVIRIAVMAADTVIRDALVREGRRDKRGDGMADMAILHCR